MKLRLTYLFILGVLYLHGNSNVNQYPFAEWDHSSLSIHAEHHQSLWDHAVRDIVDQELTCPGDNDENEENLPAVKKELHAIPGPEPAKIWKKEILALARESLKLPDWRFTIPVSDIYILIRVLRI